jgi:hypothetical protein
VGRSTSTRVSIAPADERKKSITAGSSLQRTASLNSIPATFSVGSSPGYRALLSRPGFPPSPIAAQVAVELDCACWLKQASRIGRVSFDTRTYPLGKICVYRADSGAKIPICSTGRREKPARTQCLTSAAYSLCPLSNFLAPSLPIPILASAARQPATRPHINQLLAWFSGNRLTLRHFTASPRLSARGLTPLRAYALMRATPR